MPESIYIETTIPSLYVARPSGQLVEAARQRLTRIWWDEHRRDFDLVCSQTVLDECGRGESEMAAKRLAMLDSIPLLELAPEVLTISQDLLSRDIIPMKAVDDAIHIAVSAVHEIEVSSHLELQAHRESPEREENLGLLGCSRVSFERDLHTRGTDC